MASDINFILGNYQLLEVLGIGAMGYIYRARQINLDRDVAVKILLPNLAREADYINLFIREARTAAALEHPHIVPVIDYGVQQDIRYVAMRYLPGGSLGDRIDYRMERGLPLPSLPEISRILTQAASALDYAHVRGVIHRDIKPNNLVFDQHGVVYIVDFGIAKLSGTTSSVKGSTFLGTPSYMAPEQWQGFTPTPAVDQYALGAVVYMMITGRPPFESEIALALMSKHLKDTPADVQIYRPSAPDEINAVLQRAMAKQPEDRYPTAMEFAQAFAAAARESDGDASTEFATFTLPRTTLQFPMPTSMRTPATTANIEQVVNAPPPPSTVAALGRNLLLWLLSGLVLVLTIALVTLLASQQAGRGSVTPTQVAGIGETPTPTTPPTIEQTSQSPPDGNIPVSDARALATAEASATVAATTAATNRLPPTLTPSHTPTEMVVVISSPAPAQTSVVLSRFAMTNTAEAILGAVVAFTPAHPLTDLSGQALTATFTPSPSSTPSDAPVLVPSLMPTYTPSPSSTSIDTLTLAPSLTATATGTFTQTQTRTPTVTDRKPTFTRTLSPPPTDTPTETPTPTDTRPVPRRTENWGAGQALRINNPNGAWLRTRPSTSASQVTTLANNNPVTATGRSQYDGRQWWWEVRSSWGAVGWVEQYSLAP